MLKAVKQRKEQYNNTADVSTSPFRPHSIIIQIIMSRRVRSARTQSCQPWLLLLADRCFIYSPEVNGSVAFHRLDLSIALQRMQHSASVSVGHFIHIYKHRSRQVRCGRTWSSCTIGPSQPSMPSLAASRRSCLWIFIGIYWYLKIRMCRVSTGSRTWMTFMNIAVYQ